MRIGCVVLCSVGAMATLSSCATHLTAANWVLHSPQGALVGYSSEHAADVAVFRGVPYALAPVGARRWKPAEPLLHWHGTRSATSFEPDCMQPPTMSFTEHPERDFFYHPPNAPSEDCLYANVWMPAAVLRNGEKLPVMVWIHGGGFVQGAGSWPLYDGARLAQKGVVVVTFNYRLGIFGYFAHPELSAESPQGASGNYGASDQIAVLQWVRRNISSYGGDPNRVTVFGESAGAISITQLMASPLARDLFQRAIGESGASFWPMPTLNASEAAGAAFSASIGAPSLAGLRLLPADELLRLSREREFPQFPHMANVDGWIFPDPVFEVFRRGQQAPVPVLIGFNSDEVLGALPPPVSQHAYVQAVRQNYGQFADDLLRLYPAAHWRASWAALTGYDYIGWHTESWARFSLQAGQPVYLYYFAHAPAGAEGAFHTSEIAFVFNNEAHSARYSANMPHDPPREADLRLADLMSSYWVNFARNGAPNEAALPYWPAYTRESESYMRFEAGAALSSTNLLPAAWEIQSTINAARRHAQ